MSNSFDGNDNLSLLVAPNSILIDLNKRVISAPLFQSLINNFVGSRVSSKQKIKRIGLFSYDSLLLSFSFIIKSVSPNLLYFSFAFSSVANQILCFIIIEPI